jgi:hypothetical protein
MNIAGRFFKASDTTYRDGKVAVGFVGNITPWDLTMEDIQYIKSFYNMHGNKYEICQDVPEKFGLKAKKSANGYLVLFEENYSGEKMSYEEFLDRIDELVGYVVEFEAIWKRDGTHAGRFQRYVWDNKEFGPPSEDALMETVGVRVIRKG